MTRAHNVLTAAYLATPFAAIARVEAMGVPQALLAQLTGAGQVAAGRVAVSPDGRRFEPKGADARLLLGVTDPFGTVIDVVALSSTCEDDWALLTGHGDVLGVAAFDAVDHALATERPARLQLHATPWDWLRGGGEGICVLDWNRGVLAHLRSLGERVTLMVDGAAMKARLKAMLARGGVPLVSASGGAVLGRAG
ncbi:hypothetical protein [Aurantiacibacter luteus]|uniref:Uncharacterized protein n=1 Tax=Aurantiacibacter luteus TaxID=1581420 RepID=A0A0G9MSY9_9SPHN|nr:hypothetical protein [Aurantiacibacter luteus]KLE32443.1 hypothetical protein AAW00_13505 [Aurantiacibacter luteus]